MQKIIEKLQKEIIRCENRIKWAKVLQKSSKSKNVKLLMQLEIELHIFKIETAKISISFLKRVSLN
jgi:hypothetical protein